MSSTFLKSIALIFMLVDHIGEFIPNSPIWLRYIGRLALPIFFYCSAWGFYYTHDRRKHLIRLYVFSVLMAIGNIALSHFVYRGRSAYLINNIFTTIFLGCLILYIWEAAADRKKRIIYFLIFGLQQIIVFLLILPLEYYFGISYELHYAVGAVFGSCIITEGSLLFVLYFVCVYFLKERTFRLSLFAASFSLFLAFLMSRDLPTWRGPLLYLLPFADFQWLMMLAIPFYYLYNGKRGKNVKFFFYIFYPMHIWILYIMGYFCEKI